jgi:signal peptidase II
MFAGQGLIVVLLVIALAVAVICNIQDLNWAGWEPNLVGGCLCGGALGNLADRLRSGYVVDFIDAHAGAHHWPIFNMADSLICVSVGWILVRQFWGKKRGTTA